MIEIIGTIGFEALAQDVRAGLEASGDAVDIYIDSPGGDVMEANAISLAIADYAMRNPDKRYTCTLGALCASAAANIVAKLPRAFRVRAYESTLIMYHSCAALVEGTPDQLLDNATMMQLVNEAVMRELASRTTLAMDEIRAGFSTGRELWLDGRRALECGLVQELLDAAPGEAAYSTDRAGTRQVLALVAQYKAAHQHMEAKMAEETTPVTPEKVVAEDPAKLAEEEIKEEVAEELETPAPEIDWEAECGKLRQECDELRKEVEGLKALVAKYQPSATPKPAAAPKAGWLDMLRELNAKHLPEQEYARAYSALKAAHRPEFDAFMAAHTVR